MEALSAFLISVGEVFGEFWWPLTIIGGVLGMVAASAVIPILNHDDSFAQIRDWAIKPGRADRYRDLIAYGLRVTAKFYGPGLGLSWRGYGACLIVAYAYPVFLWLFAWALGGPGALGGLPLLDETKSPHLRWFGLVIVCAATIFLALFFKRIDQFTDLVERFLTRSLHRAGLIGHFPRFALRAAIAAIAVVAVVAVVGGVGGVAVVAVFAGGAGVAVVWFVFLIFLPTANAVLDHVSIQVSRWLLTDLVNRRNAAWQWLIIIGHVSADVFFAGLFLVLLAILLPAVLQLANHAFGLIGWAVVEWGLYLEAARHKPFGAGWLVTGMLVTTLLPTVVHLLAAGGALALPAIGGGRIETLAAKSKTTLLDRFGFLGLIGISVFFSWAAMMVIAIVFWQGAEHFTGPLVNKLADLAVSTGRAIGGPGMPGT